MKKYVSPAPIDLPPGPPEAEVMAGAQRYLEVLQRIHRDLAPQFYLEIGVRMGKSLALAACPAIGVDPEYDLQFPIHEQVRLFAEYSDDFFLNHDDLVRTQPLDLVFIDGMHLFEYALRDFINIEKRAHQASLVVFDDVCPNHPLQARRERETRVWTGDVWKIHACLQQYRPDLTLLLIDSYPSGLLLVAGLKPDNQLLQDNYDQIVSCYNQDDRFAEPPRQTIQRSAAVAPGDPAVGILLHTMKALRENGASITEVESALRRVVAT